MRDAQRSELHRTIWKIANDLRGSVDGWDFKVYVLNTLFYRFISEDITDYINKIEDSPDSSYADRDDESAEIAKDIIIKQKGFFILPSELFCNVIKKIKADANFATNELNDGITRIFKNIEKSSNGKESESKFKGIFADFDVRNNALGTNLFDRNKKLKDVLLAISELKFDDFKDSSIDVFGDAYEYLMRMYASSAGKSGGEYFTPQEVSRLLAQIAASNASEVNKVYDPACGSGSLLLQVKKAVRVNEGFFGQEKNITSYNLCRMNLFLHGINFNNFDIAHGDTLTKPNEHHALKSPFDIIVSNPPYSTKWEGDSNSLLSNDSRFMPAGILAPKNYSDLAFVMHIVSWLSNQGIACVVEFPGVLYRKGAEAAIRRYLIKENYIDCVIQMPENLFFGVSIATCILVLRKNKAENKTLFINASEFFVKATNKNKLSDENIAQILDLYKKRESVPHLSSLVANDEILSDKDCNLGVSRFIEAKDTREKIDIAALNLEIQHIVARQDELRKDIDKIIKNLQS